MCSCPATDREQVHKARDKENGNIVAVKIMELERAGAVPPEVQKEIDFMRSCDHENIIKFHASYGASLFLLCLSTKLL